MPAGSKQQQTLPLSDKRTRNSEDYLGLFPARVMPSLCEVLEQGDSLLVIKRFKYKQAISPGQVRLFKSMVAFGAHPDAPGSVTVFCVWGSKDTAARELVVFDWTGRSDPQALSNVEYRAKLHDWFESNRRHR